MPPLTNSSPLEPEPSITVPLKLLLDALISFREHANIEATLALYIQQHDPEHKVCYVEFPSADNLGGSQLNIPRVYRIDDWRKSNAAWLITKTKSEERRKAINTKQEKVEELARAIKKKLSIIEEETCRTMAEQIVSAGNLLLAQQFGVNDLI